RTPRYGRSRGSAGMALRAGTSARPEHRGLGRSAHPIPTGEVNMSYVTYFFEHTDALGATLFCLLVLMSLASWFCIAAKGMQLWQLSRNGERFRHDFWRAPMPVEHSGDSPFARLAAAAIAVHNDVRDKRSDGDELLLRCMQRLVGEEGARLDNGQTLLASIA